MKLNGRGNKLWSASLHARAAIGKLPTVNNSCKTYVGPSRGEQRRVRRARPRRVAAALAFALSMLALLCGAEAQDGVGPFEHPPALERDIGFWIRVYTEVTTDGGLLHDDWNLGVVYEVLRFDPADSPAQREHRVTLAKARYAELLRRFAAGDTENL